MQKIENVRMEYNGYRAPKTDEEIEIEILGIQSVISAAQHRIDMLRQMRYLRRLTDWVEDTTKESAEQIDDKTVEEATETTKIE